MADDRSVQFHSDGIGHLLKDMLFIVPPHQRSYMWEKEEHVEQLFRDVQDSMDDGQADGYFLGMIVLKRGQNLKDRLEVIDGQQRMATVSMFLASVRDYFNATSDTERASDIQREYIATRDSRTLNEEARLHLNTDDRAFFERHVVKGIDLPRFSSKEKVLISHRRIADAMAACKAQVNRLASLSPSSAKDRLFDWVEYFLHKARVVAIFVPEEQNAYTLFETLNDRGLELSKADLIKNHLFGRSAGRLDEVRMYWTEMTATLEASGREEGAVNYIRHFWISRHEHIRTKQLYDAVKRHTNSPGRVHETAKSLRDDAMLYAAIANPEARLWHEYGDSTREHVRTLLDVGVAIIKPMALSVLRKFTPKDVANAFHLFVNWSVRLLLVGGHRSESYEIPFSKMASDIHSDEIKTAAAMARRLAGILPADEAFRSAFATASVTKALLARYFLRAIEGHRAAVPHPEWIVQPDSDKVNLEHVLPLNPGADWEISAIDAESLHNRLGNLAILAKATNLSIGNKGFLDKAKAFRKNSFVFTSWIGDQRKWTEEEINQRQELLADEAIQIWTLRL